MSRETVPKFYLVFCPYKQPNHKCDVNPESRDSGTWHSTEGWLQSAESLSRHSPACMPPSLFWHRLHACYVNSARKGHFCSNPDGSGRCPVAMKHAVQRGFRSFTLGVAPKSYSDGVGKRTVKLTSSDERGEKPVYVDITVDVEISPRALLVYSPKNAGGTEWIVINVLTGERKEVDMKREGFTTDGAYLEAPWYGWRDSDLFYSATRCAACLHPDGCAVHGNGALRPLVVHGDDHTARYFTYEEIDNSHEFYAEWAPTDRWNYRIPEKPVPKKPNALETARALCRAAAELAQKKR